jgi:hypothetical protein
MKRIKAGILALSLLVAGGGMIESAEAARFGGGRSIGVHRSIPQRQAQPQGTTGQAAQTPSRWMAPIAGVAAGLGLGWLLAQGGMGPMLLGLFVLACAISLIMMMARRDQAARDAANRLPPGEGSSDGPAA